MQCYNSVADPEFSIGGSVVVSVNQNTGGKTFVRRTLPIYLEQTRRTRRTRIKIKYLYICWTQPCLTIGTKEWMINSILFISFIVIFVG